MLLLSASIVAAVHGSGGHWEIDLGGQVLAICPPFADTLSCAVTLCLQLQPFVLILTSDNL